MLAGFKLNFPYESHRNERDSSLSFTISSPFISGALMECLTKAVQLFSLLLAFSFIAPSAKADQLDLYEGVWRQVKSNSGDCPKCSITIRRDGSKLEVIANNGWYASVQPVPKRLSIELPSVQGDGVWRTKVSGQSQETPIKVALVHDESQLHLALIIGYPDHPRTIEATFQK